MGGIVRIGLSDTQLVEVDGAATPAPDSREAPMATDGLAGREDALAVYGDFDGGPLVIWAIRSGVAARRSRQKAAGRTQ